MTGNEASLPNKKRLASMGNQPLENPSWNKSGPEKRLLLLFFGRIALLADFAVFLGFHAAFMAAVLAFGFRLVAAGFGTGGREAANEDEGADNCTKGLHVLPFLPAEFNDGRWLVVD